MFAHFETVQSVLAPDQPFVHSIISFAYAGTKRKCENHVNRTVNAVLVIKTDFYCIHVHVCLFEYILSIRMEEHATQEASLKLREQLVSHERELVRSQNEWLSRYRCECIHVFSHEHKTDIYT